MAVLCIASTEAYSGKSGICLSLGLEIKSRGLRVGYIKPVGTTPGVIDGKTVDMDAHYLAQQLETGDAVESVSPLTYTKQFINSYLKGADIDGQSIVKNAFNSVSSGKDSVIVECGANMAEGRVLGVSAAQVANMLDGYVVLIANFRSELVIDDIIEAKERLGDRFVGVIFNKVMQSKRQVAELAVSYLTNIGIKTYGLLPRDRTLMSVTVGEITECLGGTILTAAGKTEDLVENIMVGAMGQDKALRFFQRTANKAVITGGDRADVQLAALETPTKAIILTGNFQPSPIVMARAEDIGVPMILVNMDTLNAVEKTGELIGKVGMHQPQKIERFRELLKTNVDIEKLFKNAGII